MSSRVFSRIFAALTLGLTAALTTGIAAAQPAPTDSPPPPDPPPTTDAPPPANPPPAANPSWLVLLPTNVPNGTEVRIQVDKAEPVVMTPMLRLRVDPGLHVIQLTAEGYAPLQQTVIVPESSTVRMTAFFASLAEGSAGDKPLPGTVLAMLGQEVMIKIRSGALLTGRLLWADTTGFTLARGDGVQLLVGRKTALSIRLAQSEPPPVPSLAPGSGEDPDAPHGNRGNGRVGGQLALRLGYALPFGDADASLGQSDFVSGQAAVELDANYKFAPWLAMGLYFGMGFGGAGSVLRDTCGIPGVSCGASTIRVGAQILEVHIRPNEDINPYFGLGFGYERTQVTLSYQTQSSTFAAEGVDFMRLNFGVDYRVNTVFGIGAYTDMSLGLYTNIHQDGTSSEIGSQKPHGWFSIGTRAVLFP